MMNFYKTFLILPAFLTIFGPAVAADNIFFGKYNNQFALNIGGGVNSGFLVSPPAQFVPYSVLHFQYSRPNTFFTLPARASLNFAQTLGWGEKYGWNWRDLSIPIVFLSEDVALLSGEKWYFAGGAGVGFQAQENDRIGSKLIFQFKLTVGYKINDRINTELFMQHFSNGNTGYANNSYAFWGLGLTYQF